MEVIRGISPGGRHPALANASPGQPLAIFNLQKSFPGGGLQEGLYTTIYQCAASTHISSTAPQVYSAVQSGTYALEGRNRSSESRYIPPLQSLGFRNCVEHSFHVATDSKPSSKRARIVGDQRQAWHR